MFVVVVRSMQPSGCNSLYIPVRLMMPLITVHSLKVCAYLGLMCGCCTAQLRAVQWSLLTYIPDDAIIYCYHGVWWLLFIVAGWSEVFSSVDV